MFASIFLIPAEDAAAAAEDDVDVDVDADADAFIVYELFS